MKRATFVCFFVVVVVFMRHKYYACERHDSGSVTAACHAGSKRALP